MERLGLVWSLMLLLVMPVLKMNLVVFKDIAGDVNDADEVDGASESLASQQHQQQRPKEHQVQQSIELRPAGKTQSRRELQSAVPAWSRHRPLPALLLLKLALCTYAARRLSLQWTCRHNGTQRRLLRRRLHILGI